MDSANCGWAMHMVDGAFESLDIALSKRGTDGEWKLFVSRRICFEVWQKSSSDDSGFWCRQVRNHQLYVFNFHHHRIHQLSTAIFFQKRKKLQNVFSRLINVQITWKTWFCIFVKTKNTSKRFYFIEKTLQNMSLIRKCASNSKLSSTELLLT